MTIKNMLPDKAAILGHLQFLFKDQNNHQDGKIEIAYSPANSGAVNQAEWFDAINLEAAADFAFNINKKPGVNVYVGAALRIPDASPIGRSNINDYYASTTVWCDIDDSQAASAAKDLYKALPPSFIVVTGRKPHLRAQMWWKLMHAEENKETQKANLAHICAALNGDPAVVDPARVMRLGGSIAWPKKEGRIPELTEIKRPEKPTVMVMSERFKDYFPDTVSRLTATMSGGIDGKPRNLITGSLKIHEILEKTKQQGHWHMNMRDAVASLVNRQWTDEQIRLTCGPYCTGGPSDNDLAVLINGARGKWNIPEPTNDLPFDPETGEIIEGKQKLGGREIPLLYASDIQANIETADFVEGLLCDQQFSVIYGESNCGKTFFMLDLSMHVALGLPWRDKAVEQGGVIYAALEGGHGTRNRIVAFKQHYNITSEIPLAVIPSNINFLSEDGDDVLALINAISTAKVRIGNIKLIVIDTLARAISGGDENSSMDMGRMIMLADKIRALTGAHIAFVHHSGKDSIKGARGHSSLRAAVDTEIEISRQDEMSPSKIKVVKQREMEMSEDLFFQLISINLGTNKRNKEVTSCVVLPAQEAEEKNMTKMSSPEKFVYDAIVQGIINVGSSRSIYKDTPPVMCIDYFQMAETLEAMGYKKLFKEDGTHTANQATLSARMGLKKKGFVGFNRNYLWINKEIDEDSN